MNVQEFLKRNGVEFEVIPHEQAYTAQEVAAAEHVSGHSFAKTVIIRGADKPVMLVLPASRHVDLKKVAALLGGDVQMLGEEEMKKLFADCEIGAEPPFGSQYGVETFVDESLGEADAIVFRAGTHDQTIRMSYADYQNLEKPTGARFAAEAE